MGEIITNSGKMVRGYEIGRNPSVSKADVTDAIKRADSYNSYNGTDHRHYAGETTRNFRGHSPIETGRTNFSIANTPKNIFAINPSNKRLSYTGRNRLQNQVERKIRSKTGSDVRITDHTEQPGFKHYIKAVSGVKDYYVTVTEPAGTGVLKSDGMKHTNGVMRISRRKFA